MSDPAIQLRGRPERIFVSVDERTGRSALSFAPPGIGGTVVREGDARGEGAMAVARGLATSYPGCIVTGPHFHTSKAEGSKPRRRR